MNIVIRWDGKELKEQSLEAVLFWIREDALHLLTFIVMAALHSVVKQILMV